MSNWARKFGLFAGGRLFLVHAPEGAAVLFATEAPAVALLSVLPKSGRVDHIFYWPEQLAGLRAQLDAWLPRIEPAGAIWLLLPKKKFAPARGIDFTWASLQAAALATDLVDNKIASFSDTDYGTRFVIRRERRANYD